MTWYILRHAEKERGDFYNPHLRHQDQPLSDRGRQEAEKWAGFFADKAISAIYVSGYIRTSQTIERAAEALKIVPVVDERLNELDGGVVDGMTAGIHQDCKEVIKYTKGRDNATLPEST